MPPSSRACGPSRIAVEAVLLDSAGRAAPVIGRGAEQQGGAGRRVELVAVVHLDDLDVPVGPEPPRRLLDQRAQQIDAERGVGGLQRRRSSPPPRRSRDDARASRPVVPITIGVPAATAASRWAWSASGAVKSTSTSLLAASAPASSPRSTPPAERRPRRLERASAIARPIRPLAPRIPIAGHRRFMGEARARNRKRNRPQRRCVGARTTSSGECQWPMKKK